LICINGEDTGAGGPGREANVLPMGRRISLALIQIKPLMRIGMNMRNPASPERLRRTGLGDHPPWRNHNGDDALPARDYRRPGARLACLSIRTTPANDRGRPAGGDNAR
jgi:hypothetical protein